MSNGKPPKTMIPLGEIPEIGKKPEGPPQGGPGSGIPVPQFINNILIPKIGEIEEKIDKLVALFEVFKVVQPAFPSKIEVTVVQAPAPKAKKPTTQEAKKETE